MPETNRQIVLDQIPQGRLGPEHFRLIETAPPTPADGEALVRTRYISLDAANRAWMQGATYRSALSSGQVMAGGAIGEVVESRDPSLAPGDLVSGDIGWQDYAAVPARRLQKLPRMEPVTHLMSVFGVAGLTAYFGLLECGQPKPGESVVVSAAAGSVGSLVGQIAKIKGCRVVGIAGGRAKCDWLKAELGFDEALDYKSGELKRLMREALPGGIDVYFDNVGGDIFEACLFAMNVHGRIACCGAVSQYDGPAPAHGPRGIPGLIVTKRLTLRGFIVSDFNAQRDAALKDLEGWVAEGRLKVQEDILEGLENTPAALIGLLAGENRGKRMVKV
ncbi:NADP-dependent oxidoreductase [Phenylobacterium sp.]|uniref:NADP-dependent oxidoreductase n=1 Tax=Phenylobacterium sp. TaxID=1871053 RepID=UPI0026380F94|nr:NADP-dependent oxidoreductase [Phenylobacterium sp.]